LIVIKNLSFPTLGYEIKVTAKCIMQKFTLGDFMIASQSLSNNLPGQRSDLSFVRQATRQLNSTFATAKSLGVLRASSSPVTFKLKGGLTKSDRNDFVQLEIAPGASFSSITNLINVKGGDVKVTSYFQIPGSSPQKVNTSKFTSGKKSQVTNSPFSNSFGISVQLFVQVRSVSPSKDIFYNSRITFTS